MAGDDIRQSSTCVLVCLMSSRWLSAQTCSVCARSSPDFSRNFERGLSMDYKGYKYAIKMSVYAHICAAMLIGRQPQVFLQCDTPVTRLLDTPLSAKAANHH